MGRLPGGIVDETRDYIIREVDAMHKRRLLKLSTSMLSSAPSKGLPRLLTLSLSLLALSSPLYSYSKSLCSVHLLSVYFSPSSFTSLHAFMLASFLPPCRLLLPPSLPSSPPSASPSASLSYFAKRFLCPNSYPQHSQPRCCLTLSNLQAGVCYHLTCRLPLPSFQQ